jgi:hypothetical protein
MCEVLFLRMVLLLMSYGFTAGVTLRACLLYYS